MDTESKDNLEPERKNEEVLNYHSPNISSEWQLNGKNLPNSSLGLIPPSSNNPTVFAQNVWNQPSCSQNIGFYDMNLQQNVSASPSLTSRNSMPGALGGGMGMFLPTVPGLQPESLAEIPADSGFIERAARFSCFRTGNFGDITNPVSPESLNPYCRGMPGIQSHRDEMNMLNARAATVHDDQSPLKSEGKSEILARSHDEGKQCSKGASELGSDEAEFSGRDGDQEEFEGVRAKGLGSKKRKITGQKEDQNTTSTSTKPGVKNLSDPPKEEYIHIRARRGQATNSHSLAERVRREKISERMKFLQDLVPGCSKVTGKAVMLDEIINYVQSLQRQVEFLSMKLSTVNPKLDINVERLFAKDMHHHRACPSSSLDLTLPYHPALHTSPPGLIQASMARGYRERSIISPEFTSMARGYREPMLQAASWEDELHNVIQMGLNSLVPQSNQDLSDSLPSGKHES